MQETKQHYELTYLLAGNLAENEQGPIQARLKQILDNLQAELGLSGTLGKRKLAYEVGNYKQGFYFWQEFNLTPGLLPTLEKELKLERNLVRFLIIKKKELTAEEIAKNLARQKAALQAESIAETKEEATKQAKAVEEIPVSGKKDDKPEKISKHSAPKISLEDLDKKLDEILDDNML